MDWMQAHGLSVWQFLPIGPTGIGNSPYQPLSVFAGNPWLIDFDELVDWGLLTEADLESCPSHETAAVDYQVVATTKDSLLAKAAERFQTIKDSYLLAEYEHFRQSHDELWLNDYAAFTLLREQKSGTQWPDWDRQARNRPAAYLADLEQAMPAQWERAKITQFLFAKQWQALRDEAKRRDIVLFGDVPIYMALDCAEAWANPELIHLDSDSKPIEVAGVPPDYFSRDGQLWGNPVYRWDVHEADGFTWWISRLRHALSRADLVRLDHFRGFDEYWSVPNGAATAREGQWKPGPGYRLFDALAAAFGRVPIVAEDLGLITPSVVALRKAYAFPGMQVLQFLVNQVDFEFDKIEEDCVCYTGTHDNDTSLGWYSGSDGQLAGAELEQMQSVVQHNVPGAAESVHRALVAMCFRTRARFAIAPLQDFLGLGSEARLNTPGTSNGNWRWRVRERELVDVDCGYIGSIAAETGRA
jgi:4-alpha-glucanotransferase